MKLDLDNRKLIQDFITWCDSNHLHPNTTKTREMMVGFRRPRPPLVPVTINVWSGVCTDL